jgi:hypothetical protein
MGETNRERQHRLEKEEHERRTLKAREADLKAQAEATAQAAKDAELEQLRAIVKSLEESTAPGAK